jgi:hypothetical protein
MPELHYLVLVLIPVLVFPLGMGLLMWLMMHGRSSHQSSTSPVELELARLRAEITALQPARAGGASRRRGPT